MQSDWILDVLADLKTFAAANGLPALAEQLDDTAIVALAEISDLEQRTGRQGHEKDIAVGAHPGSAGAG